MWTVEIRDTQTGALRLRVEASGGAWGRGDTSERQHTFMLRGDGLDRATRKDLFRKWDRTIVQCWDGAPVYAGLVSTTSWDPATGVLTVSHVDIRAIARRRMLFGVGSYAPSGTTVCTSLSRRGIARRIIYLGFVYEYSSAWPLPVNLPAEEAGSITRTYYHYEFQTIDKLLSDVQSEDGGPDVDFQPKLSGGLLSWDALIGSPYLTGPPFEFILKGDAQPSGVSVTEDGQKQATGVFALGKGSEQDMRVGSIALSVTAGISKDFVVPHKDVDDVNRLNSLAASDVTALASPTVQWTMAVDASIVNPAEVRIGSPVKTWSQGDEWIDDGWTTHRIIAFSGDFTNKITLTLEVQ